METNSEGPSDPGTRHLSQLYKAIAHPVRLHILRVLLHEEACVCHLTCLLGRPQPYVSQQLTVLRDAGLVTDRREGQLVYYRAADPRIANLIALGQQLLTKSAGNVELPAVSTERLADCHCPRCEIAPAAAPEDSASAG